MTTTFANLPTDILVEFLRSLDSLNDTLAMISTAKYVYEAFKVHPNHILRAVICRMIPMNEVVFPVAFGLVLQVERARPSDSSVSPRKGLLSDEDLSTANMTLMRMERLQQQHKRIIRLERDFSRLLVVIKIRVMVTHNPIVPRMKDSRFGYSTLTREESRRFQVTAYTYGQFQVLFGIDRGAKVQPWEYGSESVPNGQITPRAFLDSLSTPQLHRISRLKDFLLPWTDSLYLVALRYRQTDMSDLSRGKYIPTDTEIECSLF